MFVNHEGYIPLEDHYLDIEESFDMFMDNSSSQGNNQSDTQANRDNDLDWETGSNENKPYPLNIPEASYTAEIPGDIVTPNRNDDDPHLTLLRNEVRIAYNDAVSMNWRHRETDDPIFSRLEDRAEKQLKSPQKELRGYLNDKYNGDFEDPEVESNSN